MRPIFSFSVDKKSIDDIIKLLYGILYGGRYEIYGFTA